MTEGSFDTYMWQTLERKAAFIAQVTRGDLPDRDVDDIGDQALSFAEVKALATGDPLVLEKAGVDADVARLTRLERAHHEDQHRLRSTLDAARQRIERSEQRAAALTVATERLVDTRGDRFAMTIGGDRYTKRVDAGRHLQQLLAERLDATPPETNGPVAELGTLGGLAVSAQTLTTIDDEIRLTIPDAHIEITYASHEWRAAEPSSIVNRLERHLQRLPDALTTVAADADTARAEAARAEARIGQPWGRSDELARLRRRQHELDEALAASTGPEPTDCTALPVTPSIQPRPAADDLSVDVERMTTRLDALTERARDVTIGLER